MVRVAPSEAEVKSLFAAAAYMCSIIGNAAMRQLACSFYFLPLLQKMEEGLRWSSARREKTRDWTGEQGGKLGVFHDILRLIQLSSRKCML
jgi:hypothetical protein